MMEKTKRHPAAWFDRKLFWKTVLLSVCITFVIEALGRHSLLAALWFMLSRPTTFGYNVLMIFFTLSPALAFRRRVFALALPSAIWLGLGLANCVTLFFRVMPLEAIDFAILRTGIMIWHCYLTSFQMGMIIAGIVLLIAGFVILWSKVPKMQAHRLQAAVQFVGSAAMLAVFGVIFYTSGLLHLDFSNVNQAYSEGGFCYSLCMSAFDRGVDEPEDYSRQSVEEIVAAIAADESTAPEVLPNIIFLQLESFFDPSYIDGYTYETNPVPVFSALKTRCSTGLLSVPGIGSGTANTEFEMLTGMRLDDFGAGEYPFQTILMEKACESLAWNLKEFGYTAQAIHNNTATFYERHIAYASLGFDVFEPIEYMQNVPYNPTGWAKDSILTREIEMALNATEGPDFVWTVSVQLHGKYPTTLVEGAPVIAVEGVEDEGERNALMYYLGQLHEVDNFISALVNRLSHREEPTLVVLFGDHLPSITLEEERFTRSNLYQTEYLIWANYNLPKVDEDLEAYQLGARVLELAGIDNGTLIKLHQRYGENPDYLSALAMLEYDMLYGDAIVYGGTMPYEPTDLRMGIETVQINSAALEDETLIVRGDGLNSFSRLRVNGTALETEFSSGVLCAPLKKLAAGDEVTVEQVTETGVLLGVSQPFVVEE